MYRGSVVSGVEDAATAAGAFNGLRALITILKGTWRLHLQPRQLETLWTQREREGSRPPWLTGGAPLG